MASIATSDASWIEGEDKDGSQVNWPWLLALVGKTEMYIPLFNFFLFLDSDTRIFFSVSFTVCTPFADAGDADLGQRSLTDFYVQLQCIYFTS